MKTGLVLEGGGMRGIYTVGVLDALLDNDVHFDYCIGVSAGAGNAAALFPAARGAEARRRRSGAFVGSGSIFARGLQ